MKLRMIGIDHSRAPVEVRERYAFTKTAVRAVMQTGIQTLDNTSGIRGCVLLSTCNRMELYVSLVPDTETDLYALICGWKGLIPGT